MAQFQNFKDLDDFVENQIIPACTQFESQINELETKIKNCVTIQDTGNYVQQYDFDQLKIEIEDMKIKVNEMFGLRIATLTNIAYYLDLINEIKNEINNNTFVKWSDKYLKMYEN